MAGQTKVDEKMNGRPEPSPREVSAELRSIVHDAVELAELQAELALADAKECGRRSLGPFVAIAAGGSVALGATPLLLTALALGLHHLQLSLWLSFLLAGVIGMLIAGVAFVVGWKALQSRLQLMNRSKEEFQRNVRWLKTLLREAKTHYTRSGS